MSIDDDLQKKNFSAGVTFVSCGLGELSDWLKVYEVCEHFGADSIIGHYIEKDGLEAMRFTIGASIYMANYKLFETYGFMQLANDIVNHQGKIIDKYLDQADVLSAAHLMRFIFSIAFDGAEDDEGSLSIRNSRVMLTWMHTVHEKFRNPKVGDVIRELSCRGSKKGPVDNLLDFSPYINPKENDLNLCLMDRIYYFGDALDFCLSVLLVYGEGNFVIKCNEDTLIELLRKIYSHDDVWTKDNFEIIQDRLETIKSGECIDEHGVVDFGKSSQAVYGGGVGFSKLIAIRFLEKCLTNKH